jgi:hypothetical protein
MEEGEAAEETARVEGEKGPHVELQSPGVSQLTMLKKNKFLTFPPSQSPTSEAAWMQRSLVVNTETLATPETEESGADFESPPQDPPPPDEAAEPPDKDLPKQIQGPTVEGEQLELLRGEAPQCASWHISQMQARAPEGKQPLGTVHGRLPDLPDPYSRGSTIPELATFVPKAPVRAYQAWRPVPDEGACARPDPWPSLGIATADSDAYTKASVLLEGEQESSLPFEGSEQYAVPCTPQNLSSSPLTLDLPLETLARAATYSERAAPV